MKLRFFAGLTIEDAAAVLGISVATANRWVDLRHNLAAPGESRCGRNSTARANLGGMTKSSTGAVRAVVLTRPKRALGSALAGAHLDAKSTEEVRDL